MQKNQFLMNGLTKLNQQNQETWLNLDRIVHVTKTSSTRFKIIFDAGNTYSIELSEDALPDALKKQMGLTKDAPKPKGRPKKEIPMKPEEPKDVEEKKD